MFFFVNQLFYVIILITLVVGGAGCQSQPLLLFGDSAEIPKESGKWIGKVESLAVLDQNGGEHRVLCLLITSPPVGKLPPSHGEADRWNPTPDAPVRAILVDRTFQAILAEGSMLSGQTIQVDGALRNGPAPVYPANGCNIEPLSIAQAVRNEDGSIKQYIYQPSFCMTLQYNHIMPP